LGDGPHLVYGFLTTSPNAVVEPIHPKAMPVTLTTEEECEGVEPERDGAHECLLTVLMNFLNAVNCWRMFRAITFLSEKRQATGVVALEMILRASQ
jgi:putative SOS response-associated peptidase YedK